MTRRDFAGTLLLTATAATGDTVRRRPSMLIAPDDPFAGIGLLRARYAAGQRPSEDLAGAALSWILTGQALYADRAVSLMRGGRPPVPTRPSRSWVDVVQWALAFDWLYTCPALDQELKDRVASQLAEGADAVAKESDLRDPDQVSYHNYALRYLAFVTFAVEAISGHREYAIHYSVLRERMLRAFNNVLDLTQLVTPEGSYHESMDYMRITWVPLALLSELRRTQTGIDPARRYTVFRNFGETYLYKLLPDGTPSREGDNEYPLLDTRDTAALGYAVHRFKDPYSAWLLRKSGFAPAKWVLPVLQFLWDDPEVVPLDPALSSERELPHQRYFPGVGHLVMRNGWQPNSTWIEFDCGPYFAKHQHLDQNQFTIYHKGYLAIDSGADYTETESPHYLNYYRRTVAHNTVLVYDPRETFFWSEDLLRAANDGGQRMDSSRFWNTVRSRADWEHTRDLWDLGQMRVIDQQPGAYHYALGDAHRAYSERKVARFTRELLYTPADDVLFVFDRLTANDPSYRKAWLLHGVNEPVVGNSQGPLAAGSMSSKGIRALRFQEGAGEILVHCLLPKERTIEVRGGPGLEFWTPGDDHGDAWGSGQNWPLEPAGGGPLPTDPVLRNMWKTFWGADVKAIEASNRKNVIPGAWRMEVSPLNPATEDLFLHVIEIADRDKTGSIQIELVTGNNLAGAICKNGSLALFSTAADALTSAEVTLPDIPFHQTIITGLAAEAVFELNFTGPNAADSNAEPPGVPIFTVRERSNQQGVLWLHTRQPGNARLRLTRV